MRKVICFFSSYPRHKAGRRSLLNAIMRTMADFNAIDVEDKDFLNRES